MHSKDIDLLCELIDWSVWLRSKRSKCIVLTLYVLFILFIYLFASCYICFCLFMLLILLFVVDVVVACSFFNSFCCSCSGFSTCFTFLSVVGTLLLMLPLCIGASLSVCHRCICFCSYLVCQLTVFPKFIAVTIFMI